MKKKFGRTSIGRIKIKNDFSCETVVKKQARNNTPTEKQENAMTNKVFFKL